MTDLRTFSDGSPVPFIGLYDGEPITEMSRERLIEIVGEMGRTMEDMRRTHRQSRETWQAFHRVRGRI